MGEHAVLRGAAADGGLLPGGGAFLPVGQAGVDEGCGAGGGAGGLLGYAALGSGTGGGDAGARFYLHGSDAEHGFMAGPDYLAGAFAAGLPGPQRARSGRNAQQYPRHRHGLAWLADGDLAAFTESGYGGEDRGVGGCERGLPGRWIYLVGELSARSEYVDELVCAGDGGGVAGHTYAG